VWDCAQSFDRMALLESDACRKEEEVAPSWDASPPAAVKGVVHKQRGSIDMFVAQVRCDQGTARLLAGERVFFSDSLRTDAGCMVMLRVSYHPHFRAKHLKSGEHLETVVLSPHYIGFRVPKGRL
jgi:hypothetical protein